MNNLALLKTFKQDSLDVLSKEYAIFLEVLKERKTNFNPKGLGNAGRLFFKKEDLTPYLKNLVQILDDIIKMPFDNIVLQFGHAASHVVHSDIYRKSNLTIPLLPVAEPVAFYPDDTKPKGHRYGYADKSPIQISYYNYEHPILLNVCRPHAVLSGAEVKPRALLQMGWDVLTFEEIINANPNLWEIVYDTGINKLT